MPVPSKIATRLASGLKRFQPILAAAKNRDVNESDTVVLVADLLQYVFGYDKYAEITSEHAIRGTYCDLAVKLEGRLALLIEVKAIGLDLRDAFVKQAVDYAANQGVDWVVLTNGLLWRAYKVSFAKPIDHELVVELDLGSLNPRNQSHIELLYLLAKEGWQKAHLGEYHSRRQVLSPFSLGALVLSDPVLDVIRRELRRLAPTTKLTTEEIASVLKADVLKREVIEGEKADQARRAVLKGAKKALRSARIGKGETVLPVPDPGDMLATPPKEVQVS
jgi:hypothetical protein